MERLSNALHSLRSSTLKDRNKDYCILNEALNHFNVIATMTTHGEHVEMIKEEDFDNVVDINTNKENNKKDEDEESMKQSEDDKKRRTMTVKVKSHMMLLDQNTERTRTTTVPLRG